MDDDATDNIFQLISAAQWGIAGAGICVLVFVLILNCFLKNRRWRGVQEARSGFVSAEFLALRDLPKHAYELIGREAKDERRSKVRPGWKDDCGWGEAGSEYEGVHFKRFIGSSVRILESHALRRDGGLRACRGISHRGDDFGKSVLACDVEEYLGRIATALGGDLEEDLCGQYLAFYRNARIVGRECTEQEYRSFLGVFQEILKRVEG